MQNIGLIFIVESTLTNTQKWKMAFLKYLLLLNRAGINETSTITQINVWENYISFCMENM
jgi:hypothetical protein